MLSSNCRNKRLQCYDWWKKLFGSTCENFTQMAVGHGDGYTTGCLSNDILKKIIS